MGTTMHRLQISLPHRQAEFLSERARRENVSMAEVVRRLIAREAERSEKRSPESVWQMVGVAEDNLPTREGVPVSERPDLYLADAIDARAREPKA
jgi:hypothetical protein